MFGVAIHARKSILEDWLLTDPHLLLPSQQHRLQPYPSVGPLRRSFLVTSDSVSSRSVASEAQHLALSATDQQPQISILC